MLCKSGIICTMRNLTQGRKVAETQRFIGMKSTRCFTVVVMLIMLALPACVSQEPASSTPVDVTELPGNPYPPGYIPPVVITATSAPPTPYPPPPGPPTPTPIREFFGPGCYVDTNIDHFGLSVAYDWILNPSSEEGGTAYIYNYTHEEIKADHGFVEHPPGSMKIDFSFVTLSSGQSLEEWMKAWFPPDEMEQFQPYTLGRYNGVSRSVPNEYGGFINILLVDGDRVFYVNLSPADSPTLEEALEMVATLEIGGEACTSGGLP